MRRRPTYLTPDRRVWTYALAMAAAKDAANDQMRANRRTAWTREDYDLACRTLARLYPASGADPRAGLAHLRRHGGACARVLKGGI